MSCCQHVQWKPDLPDADCSDCLVVHDWPAAVMMLSGHEAAEPAPWECEMCACLLSFWQWHAPATRKSDVPRRILDVCLRPRSKIWTYWALFADVNTAVWALSKTLLIPVWCRFYQPAVCQALNKDGYYYYYYYYSSPSWPAVGRLDTSWPQNATENN